VAAAAYDGGMSDAITRLEAEITELRRELAALRAGGRAGTMRSEQRCPGCGGKKLLHVDKTKEWTHGGVVEMALLHEKKWYGPKNVGALEAWVCAGCGLVEWYAKGLDGVADGAPLHERVDVVEPPPGGGEGPYR
jgi:hypothetical protein